MQLVARGHPDIYLTGTPQITFWKMVYRRHTNFAIESRPLPVIGGKVEFGKKYEFGIARQADLLSNMYLVATLPALSIQGSNQNGTGSKKKILLKWSEKFSNSVTVADNSPTISYVFSSGQEAEIKFNTVNTNNATDIVTVTLETVPSNKTNTLSYGRTTTTGALDSLLTSGTYVFVKGNDNTTASGIITTTFSYDTSTFQFLKQNGNITDNQIGTIKMTNDTTGTFDNTKHTIKWFYTITIQNNDYTSQVDPGDLINIENAANNTFVNKYLLVNSIKLVGDNTIIKGHTNEMILGNDLDIVAANNFKLVFGQFSGSDVNAAWTERIGYALIEDITLKISQNVIDKQYGTWMDIWSELSCPQNKKKSLDRMVGEKNRLSLINNAIEGRILYIPLQFWFCTNPGLAFPLIALGLEKMKLDINIRKFDSLVLCVNNTTGKRYKGITSFSPEVPELLSCALFVDYVYLDREERKLFVNGKQEYLIEQLQSIQDITGGYIKSSSSNIYQELKFHHPVKELIWIFQDKNYATKSGNILDNNGNIIGRANSWFKYNHNPLETLAQAGDCTLGSNGTKWNGVYNDFLSREKVNDIFIHGEERVIARGGKYFSIVQPYQHHRNSPDNGIYLYSFALRPEEYQPSGTLNFSRLDNFKLRYKIEPKDSGILLNKSLNLSVYVKNYNVLAFENGKAGVLFSN